MSLRNDNEQELKRKENRFIRFFIPALLAVLIHLSFLGFKRAAPPENPDASRPKRVMLLPENSVFVEEQRLLAWMEMLDPTYFIAPNRAFGFSRIYNPGEMEDIPVKLDKNISAYGNKESFLPVPWKPKFERIKDEWPYKPSMPEPFDISKFMKNLDFPIWMSEDTNVLPQLFGNMDELREYLKKSPPESGETVLKVEFFGPNFFPKVEIAYSCGNVELDKLAVKALTVKGKLLAINDKDSDEPYFITVKWYSSRK